jgi:hypothetical protein
MKYAVSLLLLVSSSAALFGAQPSSQLLSNRDGANQQFASVGRVQAGFTCTGTWIEPASGAAADAPAYFLTAGHCVGLDPWAIVIDRGVPYTVTFNYFADTREALIGVRAVKVAWSTMRGTDLAVLELAATNGELRGRGLTPHRLAAVGPGPGAALHWVGAPTSFIPTGQAFLRRGTCSNLGTTDAIEARWHWFDEIRNDCPDTYASGSGSPLFDSASGAVVGVIGTTTMLSVEGGIDYDCFQNRPCAVTVDGPVVERDTSYASPVAPMLGCFDSTGRFDLALDGCALDRGGLLTVDPGRVTAVQPGGAWNVRVNGAYAWKQVRLGAGSCRDTAGYVVGDAPVIDAKLPVAEGDYLLCVIRAVLDPLNPLAGAVTDSAHPLIVRHRVDGTPLQALPNYEVFDTGLAYRVVFDLQAPGLNELMFKRGNLGEVNCEDPEGYRILFSIPPVIFKREFPHRLCVRTGDEAGNRSTPLRFDFGPPALQPLGIRNGGSHIRTRAIARGSRFFVDAIELTREVAFSNQAGTAELGGLRVELLDSLGVRHAVGLFSVDPMRIEALLPAGAALGPARLRVLPLDLTLDVAVVESAPGFFTASYNGFTPALAHYQVGNDGPVTPAFACDRFFCNETAIPVGAEKVVDLLLLVTGNPQEVWIGTERVEIVSLTPNAEWAGVSSLRVRMPAGFGLRGYQLLRSGEHALRLLLE